jgi:Protein of unknown function (DUF1571)
MLRDGHVLRGGRTPLLPRLLGEASTNRPTRFETRQKRNSAATDPMRPHFHKPHCIFYINSLWSPRSVAPPFTARMRSMSRMLIGLAAVFVLNCLSGCGVVGPRKDAVARGPSAGAKSKGPAKELAVAGATREPPLADPSTMIPPPPKMAPEIPAAPAKDDLLVSAPTPLPEKSAVVIPASGIAGPEGGVFTGGPAPERARAVGGNPVVAAVASEAIPESNLDSVRRMYRRAAERFAKMEGFESRLTRRETIGNKPMPEELLQYKFRRDPYSLHIKWIGLEGQGRELVYVQGKYESKVQILTGRDEGLLIAAGKRHSFTPTDSSVRSKSRFDIREGGIGMSILWFGKVLALVERDPAQANRLKYLGVKPCREREAGLEAVQETIPPDWEPLLPRGGKRTTYYDPDPASPSFGLPVLVTTLDESGRQVEYYWWDQFKPIRPTDADFDPDRLWRK